MQTTSNSPNAQPPLVLSVPLTHSDWMLRPGTPWEPEGIHYMLDQCKASGWTRVYWRLFDGGRAVYKSELIDPMGPWDDDSYWSPADPADLQHVYWKDDPSVDREKIVRDLERLDYADFDTLAEAIAFALDDPQAADARAEAARIAASERFTIAETAAAVSGAWNGALPRRLAVR